MEKLIDLIEKGNSTALAELTERAPEIRTLLRIAVRSLPIVYTEDRTVERILLDEFVELFTRELGEDA